MFSPLKAVTTVALVLGLGAAFLVTQPSDRLGSGVPGAEQGAETLFELAVPRSALPNDPTALEAGAWRLEAGTDVSGERTTSQANESMRNRAIMVTSGSFVIEPTTEALLWRAPGATPEVTPAGEAVTLEAGEAIYLPAVPVDEIDAERHLRVANPGVDDAAGVTFHVHEGSTGDPFGGFPSGLRWSTWSGQLWSIWNATEWLAADEVLFRLTHRRAEPGATFAPPAAPATGLYLIESGAVEWSISGQGGAFPDVWRDGNQGSSPALDVESTLTVIGDEPASFLELVAMPRSSPAE